MMEMNFSTLRSVLDSPEQTGHDDLEYPNEFLHNILGNIGLTLGVGAQILLLPTRE